MIKQKGTAEDLLATSTAVFGECEDGDAMQGERAAFEDAFYKSYDGSRQALVAVNLHYNRLIDGSIQRMIQGE